MITHFAVGMPVETFKSKKKSVYFFEIHNFEDKRSLVDIDQLPNMSFQFFYRVDPVFSFYRTRVRSLFTLVTDSLPN